MMIVPAFLLSALLLAQCSISVTVEIDSSKQLAGHLVYSPLDLQRLLPDPQTVPVLNERFFVFDSGGYATLDTEIVPGRAGLTSLDIINENSSIPPTVSWSTKWAPAALAIDLDQAAYFDQTQQSHPTIWFIVSTKHQLASARKGTANDQFADDADASALKWSFHSPALYRTAVSNTTAEMLPIPKEPEPTFFLFWTADDGRNLRGKLTLRNSDGNHLSLTQKNLDKVALFGAVGYCLLGVCYLITCADKIVREITTFPVQLLLVGITILKSLYLTLSYQNILKLSALGVVSNFSLLLPRVIAKLQDIILLVVFLMIALGWQTYRAHLSTVEWRFCSGIGILSLYLAVFEVPIGGFQVSRYILAALTDLCIMVAINFDIVLLRSLLAENSLGIKASELYSQVRAYELFRIVFIAFIIKPSVLLVWSMVVIGDLDPCGKYLLCTLDLVSDFVLFAVAMYAFKPLPKMALIKYLLKNHPELAGSQSLED